MNTFARWFWNKTCTQFFIMPRTCMVEFHKNFGNAPKWCYAVTITPKRHITMPKSILRDSGLQSFFWFHLRSLGWVEALASRRRKSNCWGAPTAWYHSFGAERCDLPSLTDWSSWLGRLGQVPPSALPWDWWWRSYLWADMDIGHLTIYYDVYDIFKGLLWPVVKT